MTTLLTHDIVIAAQDLDVETPNLRHVGAICGYFQDNDEALKLLHAFGIDLRTSYEEDTFGPFIIFDDQRAHFLVEHDGTKRGPYIFTIVIQSYDLGDLWTIKMSSDRRRTPEFILELKGRVDTRPVITALMELGFKQVGTITMEEDESDI
ncbi:MAG: hypothetical protein UZ21_OP11001000897 [Microgenomates bacterium OLB22]|nr:MAG: hypothetical protein UZ21_OP11001000897 [Microgenomates bacterium OLB22]